MQIAGEMTLLQNVDDFKVHYRVTRQTFEIILQEVVSDLLHSNVGGAMPGGTERIGTQYKKLYIGRLQTPVNK